MILLLEVTGPEAERLGAACRKEFGAAGGTVGRLPDNTWVLPDQYVSSRHARIRFQGGAFQIEDTSTNGVFINAPDNRLTPGQPHTLKSGDWIFIDPYEIRATLVAQPAESVAAAAHPDDPFGLGIPSRPAPADAPVAAPFADPAPLSYRPPLQPLTPATPHDVVDPLSLLGFAPQAAAPANVPTAADLARSPAWAEHFAPPAQAPAAPPRPAPPPQGRSVAIPDDYDPLDPFADLPGAQQPAVQLPPAAAIRAAVDPGEAPAAGAAGLEAVLAGAGLKNVEVTPELARAFGEILRVVVAGVMDVLQARQRIKNEFRMRMTNFRPGGNNPLKYSANVDDALHNLLVKRNAAFLGPVEAFEDAFDDLRNHQVATLAGVRVAFDAMLAEFDPDRLQEQFDRQHKGSLLSVPAKLRYWDLYRDKFGDMVRDADTTFRTLFGDEFAKAYEEQLDRLKAQGRAGRR